MTPPSELQRQLSSQTENQESDSPDRKAEPSCVSLESTNSKVPQRPESSKPGSESDPEPSFLSLRSNASKAEPLLFKPERPQFDLRVEQQSSEVPSGQSAQQHPTHLDSIFMLLEDNIVTFVKDELKKIQKSLSPDYPECSESQREDEEVLDGWSLVENDG
ncbi:hypothetical protein Q5P01_005937 [Channa striata]|uniref:Uncharacterized protein n=1 Tax=Channa striata TaxID=64152 RepID=A0AA88T7T5_CHASR|nr:hypothetical protein Q5P01_005937 [Channa striata]